jgi:hypothetical protein
VVSPTLQETVMAGGISAGLMVVGTFCRCWWNRSATKQTLALWHHDRETLLAIMREERNTGLTLGRERQEERER